MTARRIRVPVPAETNAEDRLVGSLTSRHAAYLAVAAAGAAVMLLGKTSTARISAGAVLALAGIVGALCRPYGEPIDRLAVLVAAYVSRRRANGINDDHRAPISDDSGSEEEEPTAAPAEPGAKTPQPKHINPIVMRRVLAVVTVCAVIVIGGARLMERPAAPQKPRVVVVPVPVTPPDLEQEVERALQEWLNDHA